MRARVVMTSPPPLQAVLADLLPGLREPKIVQFPGPYRENHGDEGELGIAGVRVPTGVNGVGSMDIRC